MSAKFVLVIDDDEKLRGVLSLAIEDMGYASHAVANAAEARKWLGAHAPELILLDIMMPDGNGLDFCRWVRGQPRFHGIPILVMSAIVDEETSRDALELGAADFLDKPFTAKTLKEKIGRFLKR